MRAPEVTDEIETLCERVALLADVDRGCWPAEDHSAVLLALLALQERVSAAAVMATAEWDRRESWRVDGSLTPKSWLRRHGVPEQDAKRVVRSARLAGRCEDVAKALRAGDITAGHLDALAAYVTPPRAKLFDDHSEVLLDGARNLSVDDTAAMARRWAAYADDQLNRGEPAARHGRRGVWFGRTGDLEEMRSLGDPIDFAALRKLLDRMEPPDPKATPGGPRSLSQRRYDALIALAEGSLPVPGRRDPAHTVNVVIDADTLTGGFNPYGRSDIPGDGTVLPAGVQRLLCGSWIGRVIMDAKGEILDLGREARFFSPAQQRAILIRDGGCAFDGCNRPPDWCDVHHLDPFGPPTNGATDLANGIGACRPHHTMIHERGWRPVQDEDGTWYLLPP